MKFYYNGKLIRTSANHEYTHATLNERGGVMGCRTSRQAAEAIITAEKARLAREIENNKRKLEAREAGKEGWLYKEARRSVYIKFRADSKWDTPEGIRGTRAELESFLEAVDGWKVVELEAR